MITHYFPILFISFEDILSLIGLCPPILLLGSCNVPSHIGDSHSQLPRRGHGPWDCSAADTGSHREILLFPFSCHLLSIHTKIFINLHWILSLAKIFVVCSLSRDWLFCNSVDCSPPGSSVRGILQARILMSGLPFLSPGESSLARDQTPVSLQADSLPLSYQGSPTKIFNRT